MPAPPVRPRAGMLDRGDPGRPRELAPGSVVLGRYTIQKVLGRGGMATVYLAKHQQTERLVALKLLDQEISRDPNYVERFRREARAAGRIRSEYTVAIYDLDAEVGGGLVLVMEYLEGQTVQQALRAGRMPIAKVLSFGRHMLEGLAAAHESGVIHRDLKPANLFIERSSTGGEKCKILDFGISKLADASQSELTRDGQTLGTVAYMAPEQIRGKAAPGDWRVDLYSAGVTLFVMFTGKRPIDADDPVQLLAAVLENPPLSLAQATGVPFPAPIEQFMIKALAKNPNERFQTALEMRDALVAIGRALGHDNTGPLVLPNGQGPAPLSPSGNFDAVSSGQPVSGVVETARKQQAMGPPPAALRSTMNGMGPQGSPMRAPTPPPISGGQPPPAAFGAVPPMGQPGSPQQGAFGSQQPAGVVSADVFGAPPPPAGGAFGMPTSQAAMPSSPFGMPPSPMVAAPAEPTASVPTKKNGSPLVMILGAVGVIALGSAVALIVFRRPSGTATQPTVVVVPASTPGATPAPLAPTANPTPTAPAPQAALPTVAPTVAPVAPAPAAPVAPAVAPVAPTPPVVAPVAPVAVAPPAPPSPVVAPAPVVAPTRPPVAAPQQPAPAPVVARNPPPPPPPPPPTHTSSTANNSVATLPGSTHGSTQTGSIRQNPPPPSNPTPPASTGRRRVRSRGVVEDAPF